MRDSCEASESIPRSTATSPPQLGDGRGGATGVRTHAGASDGTGRSARMPTPVPCALLCAAAAGGALGWWLLSPWPLDPPSVELLRMVSPLVAKLAWCGYLACWIAFSRGLAWAGAAVVRLVVAASGVQSQALARRGRCARFDSGSGSARDSAGAAAELPPPRLPRDSGSIRPHWSLRLRRESGS